MTHYRILCATQQCKNASVYLDVNNSRAFCTECVQRINEGTYGNSLPDTQFVHMREAELTLMRRLKSIASWYDQDQEKGDSHIYNALTNYFDSKGETEIVDQLTGR